MNIKHEKKVIVEKEVTNAIAVKREKKYTKKPPALASEMPIKVENESDSSFEEEPKFIESLDSDGDDHEVNDSALTNFEKKPEIPVTISAKKTSNNAVRTVKGPMKKMLKHFACKVCPRSFYQRDNLEVHAKRCHGLSTPGINPLKNHSKKVWSKSNFRSLLQHIGR